MNRHWNDDEFARFAAGEKTPGMDAHLSHCSQCATEAVSFQTTLTGFGEAVRHWSEREAVGRNFALPVQQPWYAWSKLVWAGAVIALFLASVPVYRAYLETGAHQQEIADNELFEQVDAAVSQTVPQPMRPLLSLINTAEQESNETPKQQ